MMEPEFVDTPPDPSPHAPAAAAGNGQRLFWPFLLAAFGTALLVFAFQSWQVWQTQSQHTRFHESFYRMKELSVTVGHLNESMVMAARMYAGTGEEHWKEDYLEGKRRMADALADMARLAGGTVFVSLVERLSAVNHEMQAMEEQAMTWAGMGLQDQATALLYGMEYEQDMNLYMVTWSEMGRLLSDRVREEEQALREHTRRVLLVSQVALPLLVGLSVLAVLLILRHLRFRRRSEDLTAADLAHARTRFESVVENMNDGLAVYQGVDQGADFVITVFNNGYERIENKARKNVLGRRLSEVFPTAAESGLVDVLRRVWLSGDSELYAAPQLQDGRIQGWHEYYVFRLPGNEVASVCTDRTEERMALVEMERSVQRFRTLYNKTPVMLHSIDAENRLVAVSDYWLAVMGYARDEVIGRPLTDFFTEKSRRFAREEALPRFFALGKVEDVPYEVVTRDGRILDVLLSAISERDERGLLERSLAVLVDVTEKKKAESALRESEERLRNVALTSGDWIWQVDSQGKYVYTSESVERILGYTPEEMRGMSPFDFMTEGHAEKVRDQLQAVVTEMRPIVDLENWNRTKDGQRVCLLTNGVPTYDGNGEFTGYFGVDKDITDQKDSQYRLQLFSKLFEATLEGITVTDPEGTITEVNQAFTDITGYSREEALGQNPRVLKSDRHEPEFYDRMWKDIAAKGSWEGEIWNRRKSGEAYPEWLSISAIRDEDGHLAHYVGVFHDITEMKRKEEQIRFQANHDALTGLPNRSLILDRLDMALARAKRQQAKVAVVYLDLDNFKIINDSLGHTVGDEVLVRVAERFTALVREGDTVARLGGDEFVFLLDNVSDEADSAHMALRILVAMERPLIVGGRELILSPSIGIALYPNDGQDPASLLKHADLAMYQAKQQGRNQYRLFTSELNERARRRLDLEGDLRRAIANEELFLVYQPKVDVAELMVRGMEALVRWQRGGEVVPPGEFISLAEETGIIGPLGLYVLNRACRECRDLLVGQEEGFRVSVNLSARQFGTAGLAETVARILGENRFPAERLELEITESVLAGNVQETVERIASLRELGVSVSVDDFGTGYSSLAYLKHFPISTLKIDRAFIMGLGHDTGDENIVKTVIQLAQNFGLTVVAEGVEEAAQYRLLKDLGCDQIQGYLFSKPLVWKDFEGFLATCSPCSAPE